MDRRTYLKAVGATAVIGSIPQGVANAQTERDPRAAYDPNAYLTNAQLTRRLKLLNQESDLITLQQIGQSAELNDPLWEVNIGEGKTNVHLITQIHGDEPAGTEAVLQMLQHLSVSASDEIERILENISLTIVPRVNPDGAMFGQDVDGDGEKERITRRTNTQPWSSSDSLHEPYYHYTPSDASNGYDLNRDFNIRPDFEPNSDSKAEWWEEDEDLWQLNLPYEGHTLSASGLRLSPEVAAVTKSFLRADPDFAITHHHQGIPAVPDTEPPEPSIMSVMAPFGPAFKKQAPGYEASKPIADYVNPFLDESTSRRSLRLNLLVAERLANTTGPWEVFDSVTRYGYSTLWGSYLDTLCPQTNAAGILYEVSGNSSSYGSRAYGLKVEASRIGFLESLALIASDPTLSAVNAENYFDIPLKGDSIYDVEETDDTDDAYQGPGDDDDGNDIDDDGDGHIDEDDEDEDDDDDSDGDGIDGDGDGAIDEDSDLQYFSRS
ncbi:M14 family zinc carboxypeptidase [Halococcus sediminicola]|uniref:M14 family zinc carboxypeptidase n=1 Tax=Halococcus sediminicola TaxID=1264579 RepID=UPI0009AE4C8D|nr:M14 family zinc carboxypeptidase [Halococcus sediminicola]